MRYGTWRAHLRFRCVLGVGLALVFALSACGPHEGDDNNNGNGNVNGNDNGNAAGDGGVLGDGSVLGDGGGLGDGGLDCEPPDMLIVLDRTMSMHRQPNGDPAPESDHTLSKWYLAIDALETVTLSFQARLRFGLELFPRDPGGNVCVTLAERIAGTTATNTQCEEGEILVSPDVNTAAAIDAALDPETTRLCRSTPIGAGLQTALDGLAALQNPIRDQYAMIVTDGQDTCSTPDPVTKVQELAAAGVNTYVLGFDASGTGVDPEMLNNMACAGMTAPSHSTNCTQQGSGWVAVDPTNGPQLYLSASDGAELTTQIGNVAAAVGCIVN